MRTRLYAKPVREGVIGSDQKQRVVWRDYLWNTGQETRTWLVDPDLFKAENVVVVELVNGLRSEG